MSRLCMMSPPPARRVAGPLGHLTRTADPDGADQIGPIGVSGRDTPPNAMNPVAITIMLSLLLGFAAAILYALVSGSSWLLALLAILVVGLFVRWG